MSYDMWFENDKGEAVKLSEPHDFRGGTFVMGGTTEASFNITYNYSSFYYDKLNSEDGIRCLYGKKPNDITMILTPITQSMTGEPSNDYWEATEGNARKALIDLLCLAAQVNIEYPDSSLTGD